MRSKRARALKTMLRPIVRFWMRDSETLQTFVDVLKVAFVEIAVENMLKSEEKINVSRISMMTGVHRRDAAKIYKQGSVPERALPDIVSRVVTTWQEDPEFSTNTKKPKTLSFTGMDSEFARLVERVSKGVQPGTVLYELERAGAVTTSRYGARLIKSEFRRSKDLERAVVILSRDIRSLITAVEENIGSDESPNMHARTEYDKIYTSELPKIRAWLWKEGRKFHKRARAYLAKFDEDFSPREG